MKKRALSFALALLLCLCLSGCKCRHEWIEATCTQPRICAKCDEIEGQPLGHAWKAATCEAPMMCTVCGEQTGVALEHQWQEASCLAPETCALCGSTRGELGEHELDGEGVCFVCGETVGISLTLENYADYLSLSFEGGIYPGSNETRRTSADRWEAGLYKPYVHYEIRCIPDRERYEYYNIELQMVGEKIFGTIGCPNSLSVDLSCTMEDGLPLWKGSDLKSGQEWGSAYAYVTRYVKEKEGHYSSVDDARRAIGTAEYQWSVTSISGYVVAK